MNLDQIPLLALIRGKLGYDNQRQRLISENVANADTPGYAPSDLQTFDAAKALDREPAVGPVRAVATNAMHISPAPARSSTVWTTQTAPDSESTLDGNEVSLEDQMMKMTEARMDFDSAVTFYQQSLGLLKTAVRKPGG